MPRSVRLTQTDLEMVDALQASHGFSSFTDLFRYCLRTAHGLEQTIADLKAEALAREAHKVIQMSDYRKPPEPPEAA